MDHKGKNMDHKDIGILASIGENAEFLNRVQKACDEAAAKIVEATLKKGGLGEKQLKGFFAEHWHAETFNVDAVLNRMKNIVAKAPDLKGKNSPDIVVENTKTGETIKKYSSKYYDKANQSVNEQKGYEDQGRIIPADQVKKAQEHLDKKIPSEQAKGRENRTQVAEDLQEVKDHLTDHVEHGKAKSETLTKKEAEQGTSTVKKGEKVDIRPQIDAARVAEEALRSGAIAAGITLGMAVAPKIYNSMVFRYREGEWPPEMLNSVFRGTGSAVAESGLRGAFATSITMSAKAGFLGQAMRTADPTMIGTLTFIAFEGAKDFGKYANGEVSGELFANGLMGKSVTASAGAYGATIGQAVIPIPIVGAMIGAMVGSLVAQNGYLFLDTVSEAYFRSEEFEQLKQANILLAGEWNQFLTNYDNWIAKNELYQGHKQAYIRRSAERKLVNRGLNAELLEALEGDDE